ncbi:MAG: DUF86 domain-containing protein [Candidatus Sigynarchaeota archaeon]
MSSNDIIRLKEMKDAAEKVARITNGKTREMFLIDELLHLASTHLIEIIGEAASEISDDLKEKHPDVPWKAIIGMRNRLIHKYFDVNLEIVWNTIIKDIPPLLRQLKAIIEAMEKPAMNS